MVRKLDLHESATFFYHSPVLGIMGFEDPERQRVLYPSGLWWSPFYGASRGAEAGLIAAATYPVGAVIARSPSHVRWEGVTAGHFPGGPAWTFDGKPLSYVPNYVPFDFAAGYVWSTVTGNPEAEHIREAQ